MIYTSLALPPWLRGGIRPLLKGAEDCKYIYGADTETFKGKPITFQFFSEMAGCHEIVWIDDPSRATSVFLKWCRSLRSKVHHVVYGHNLVFDLVSFLWDRVRDLVETSSGEFDFEHDGWRFTGVYGAPTFMHVRDLNRNWHITVVDSFSYYRASLDAASKVFCPHLRKLEKPFGPNGEVIGEYHFRRGDRCFEDYAMRDAEIAYHIGLALEVLHDEFDLPQTVSVANMAAKVFQHHYLEKPIPHPRREIMEIGLSSYHGGKNNITGPRGWYPRVSSIDISSAYPHAMASFPSFYQAELYKPYRAKQPRSVPDLGVYRVWGYVRPDAWPVLFKHDFTPVGRGGRGERLDGVCVSGFELNEAIDSGEFHPTSVDGWVYDADHDKHDPPMRRYVQEFYARKEAETDPGKRAMDKFLLNSISGKYIQTRKRNKMPHYDLNAAKLSGTSDLIAGGMFHPFIASLITGHTRARIHRLEHRFEALHTATDGIFTEQDLTGVDLGPPGLGALVHEAEGELLLFRNKLYILYGDGPYTGAKGTAPSVIKPDKHIKKAAMHGYAGKLDELERMAVSGVREYEVRKPNRLRSSLARGDTPNDFQSRRMRLDVGDLPVHAPLPDNPSGPPAEDRKTA